MNAMTFYRPPITVVLSFLLALILTGGFGLPVVAQPFGSLSPYIVNDGISNDWGDFDGDGQLDLILGTTVYRNQDGVFVDIEAELEAIPARSSDWGDYDNDGDLDLIVAGGNQLNDEYAAIVYRNDGGGTFVDIEAGLVGVAEGSSDWGDYDGDGDLDLVLAGQISPFEQTVRIYRNDGNDTFTDIGAALGNVGRGSSEWGDYDGDGDLDLVISGNPSNTRIYRNDGGETFVDISAGLEPVMFGSSDWGDYDADGDLDLIITGRGSTTTGAIIYRNDGGGTFTDIGADLDAGGFGEWGDYDNDGDLDLVITGKLSGPNDTAIYRNDGGDSFTDIGAVLIGPIGEGSWGDYDGDGDLDLIISGDLTELTTLYRNDGNDVFANPNPIGLEGSSINWVDYDDDGDLDLFATGSSAFATGQSVLYRNDGNGNLVDTGISFVDVLGGSSDWGDYDGDGDVDLVITGQTITSFVARIYRNDGNGTFTDINAGLDGVVESSSKWGDYDGDGDLDLLISGVVYRNEGNDSFVDIGSGITVSAMGSTSDWSDYDGDGDLDFVLTGDTNGVFPGGQTTRVYQNDNGAFVDIGANLVGVSYGSSEWGDYDNDGDPDLIITGLDENFIPQSTIYRNDAGAFVDTGAGLVGVRGGSSEWGDYDGDRDIDLLITGTMENGGEATILYRNDGNGSFNDAEVGLLAVGFSSSEWGDYDGDGDLDLVVAGSNGIAERRTVVYENLRISETPLLPVELLSFDALRDGEGVLLRWTTATETNNAGFEVQMRPDTETKFTSLDFVDGHGTTTEMRQYSYRLDRIAPGTYAFRLKQIDTDGAFELSPEVKVSIGLARLYTLSEAYPNPSRQAATLTLSVREAQHIRAEVFDVLGRRVAVLHNGRIESNRVYRLHLDDHNFASGTYLIRVTGERFADMRRITLVR